jgi:opacity protein-like surface antigen
MKILSKCMPSPAIGGRIDRVATLTIALILWGLTATSSLYAQENRADTWYVGLGLGTSFYSKDESTRACETFALTCELDEEDFSIKLMGGYQFNPYISLEFGFSDWGEVDVKQAATSADVVAFNANGIYAAAMPELPLGEHFSIFAELGMAFINTEVVVEEFGPLNAFLGTGGSDDVWAPIWGLGVAGHLTHWTFRLQWERIDPDSDFDLNGVPVSAPEMDVYGLSVIFRF